ncbi:hypothetical protein SAMN05444062_11299 [Pseudomonas syringae]|nr:hypothetical protein SAMN05444062_11299 [Pseudomonas syringae]
MLANTIDQAMNFCRLHRPLREQAKRRPARSHRSASSSSTTRSLTGATRTARQSTRRVLRLIQVCRGERVLVGASLLAKAMVQAMNFCRLHRPLREQARSHRSAYNAETVSPVQRRTACSSLDTGMQGQARSCGSELAREGYGSGDEFLRIALASSRASSHRSAYNAETVSPVH